MTIDIDKLIAIQSFIDLKIAPGVNRHGGEVEIVEMTGKKIVIALSGACSLCSLDTQTKDWIQNSIINKFPNIEVCEVISSKPSSIQLGTQEPVAATIDSFNL